ncbi:FtsX-like permease family protein [Mucilaginibacter achroorhodeus]|uniref:FtsX-like permease family protein n=1 Tax=Mucilaginibacter achroorhodeus TaxID=2599294 RepID=A0A563U093_9SPHI|nr:ABC transporter permease [Mucilaginibacter achroorhodeus]TWR25046.1 FtsX-like permease family protein [Mucilaginibacter achroorhodeus]
MAVKTSLKENISIALQSIGGNRLRTSLTALIIAIGIMALVGILTAIEGIKQFTNDAFAGLGANSFTVQNRGSGISFGNGGHRKMYPAITYAQAEKFLDIYKLPARTSVDLSVTGTAVAKYNSVKSNPNISVTGSNDNYLAIKGHKLAFGRNFSLSELEHGANVVIVGDEVKAKLFKDEDPINKYILLGSNKLRIIGVVAPKGSNSFGGDKFCIVPLQKARQMVDTSRKVSYAITVSVNSPDVLDASIGEATSLMRNIRGVRIGQDDNFEISRSDSIQQELSGQLAGMTIAGFAIGIITLLGAAIGLMNIMLVSVTERTREIGLRKSIGATPSVIRKQFLIEAIVICLMGGVGGIILGMAAGNLIAVNISGSFVVPWFWLFSAIALCTIIGLSSGFYPAKKASRLDPVEALRYE